MRRSRAALLLLTLAGFLLAGGSPPHLHASGDVGLWNEEHDLILMATRAADTSHLDSAPAVALVLTILLTLGDAAQRVAAALPLASDSRAPPGS